MQPECDNSNTSSTMDIMKCTYCDKVTDSLTQYYPHESGGYCIFLPRNGIEYACDECTKKKCEMCGKERIRWAFIDCGKCKKTHCFNNTDMKYENNPFYDKIVLCDARHCSK